MKLLLYILPLIALSSCRNGVSSIPEAYKPVLVYKAKHPDDYKKYAYLNVISVDTYEAVSAYATGTALSIIEQTDKRYKDQAGTNEFVKAMYKQQQLEQQRINNFFEDLKSSAVNGGVICQYEWSDGKTKEIGFLVIKGGDVIKREAWMTDYLHQ